MLPENAPVRLLSAQLEELEVRETVRSVFFQREKIGRRSPGCCSRYWSTAICAGIYSSRKLEEAWSVPHRLQMAAGGPKSSGPQHTGPVPHRTLQGSSGGPVLPVCPQAGGSGGNRPQSGVPGRHKLESRAGRYTLCVAGKAWEKQLARIKERLKTLTGLTTSAEVRSLQEEEAGEIVFVRGTGKRKSQAQRDWGGRSRPFWSGGSGMKQCSPPWEKDATAALKPTRMPPLCG